MFTGFASENTPAIQVWDLSQTVTGTNIISLTDDCAPIQFIKTGGVTTAIRVYLPSSPIEGKQLKIINSNYQTTIQFVYLYSADNSGNGASAVLYSIGPGQTLDLCYSKNFISNSPSSIGLYQSGWISLNMSAIGAKNYQSVNLAYNSSVSNNYSGAIGGSSNSVTNTFSFAGGGGSNTLSGAYSAIIGGQSNIVNQSYAAIVGGQSNTASGLNAAVVGGSSNTASDTNAVVVGGASSNATGTRASILGGFTNTANNTNSVVVGGSGNTASGSAAAVVGGGSGNATAANSVNIGGANNTANGGNSVVAGGAYATTRSINGNLVFPANISSISITLGSCQSATLLLGRQTTDATATILTSNTSAAATTNQVILPNNSAYAFQGTCIANVTAGGTTSGWKFEGVIKRGANAASTALVAAVTPTVIAQDAGASTWVLAITADTTNGGIAVTVTGAAATTIRWVCKIETTEVTF
jgi:hypothetical protein